MLNIKYAKHVNQSIIKDVINALQQHAFYVKIVISILYWIPAQRVVAIHICHQQFLNKIL